MKITYLVLIDAEYVRDAQIAPTPNEDPSSDNWLDATGDLSLGTIDAVNDTTAKMLMAHKYGVQPEQLTAYPITNNRKEELQ